MTPQGFRPSRRYVAIIAVVVSAALPIAQSTVPPGPLFLWGMAPPAPLGDFVALAAAGGGQILAIRSDRKLYLSTPPTSDAIPALEGTLATDEFCGVGMGRNHLLAIRPDGSVDVGGYWGSVAKIPVTGPPATGPFVAVTGAGGHSVALDTSGNVVVWGSAAAFSSMADYDAVVSVGAPVGITFKAIAAKGSYTVALAADGNIYGWGADPAPPSATPRIVNDVFEVGWAPYGPDHFIAPMEVGNPYIAIAAGLDLIAALRADGSAITWHASTRRARPSPTGIVFTQIGAGRNFAAGIDLAGNLHAWYDPLQPTPGAISGMRAGVYSAISAANAHVTAISGPPDTTPPVVTDLQLDHDTLWPANHKMKTIALTFRAVDCSPVALAGLSVTLRSNQPDNGSGSGNTTGDTNGSDGYTSPVAVPASAIVQNADGSVTATFEVRAERSNALPGTRVYTVSVTATDNAPSPNTSAPMTAQIVVGNGGQ